MLFSTYATADLSFDTPPAFCCNCGARGKLDFVQTPLRRTRYFFLFGSQLTLNETFPYCANCRRSAGRVRPGTMGMVLTGCLLASVFFLIFAVSGSSLPSVIAANMFYSAVALAALLTAGWFLFLRSARGGRSHYQPVSLAGTTTEGSQLRQVWLLFHNERYAEVFANANATHVATGLLRVAVRK